MFIHLHVAAWKRECALDERFVVVENQYLVVANRAHVCLERTLRYARFRVILFLLLKREFYYKLIKKKIKYPDFIYTPILEAIRSVHISAKSRPSTP